MFVYRPDICVQIQPNVRLSDIYDKKTYIQVFNVPYKSFDIGKLFIDIKDKNYDNVDMEYLSMGMTNDYEIAIQEGANIVRIGTGLFGARNYAV